MAWPKAPTTLLSTWPAAKGIQDWEVYEGLLEGFRERALVAQAISSWGGAITWATYNPWGATDGVDVWDHAAIEDLQDNILSLANSGVWVNEDALNSGKLTGLDPLDDILDQAATNSIIWSTNAAHTNDIIDELGIGRSGSDIFTRKGGSPGSITTDYGVCEEGDYCGVYIDGSVKVAPMWYEMYLILNKLGFAVTDQNMSNVGLRERRISAVGVDVDRAVAVTEAIDDWNSKGWSSTTVSKRAEGYFRVQTSGTPTNYLAQIVRYRTKMAISNCPTNIDSVCEFYLHTDKSGGVTNITEWDSEGLGYDPEEISLIHTFASSSDASRTTPYIGDIGTVPAEPTGGDGPQAARRGWGAYGDTGSIQTNYALFKPTYAYQG